MNGVGSWVFGGLMGILAVIGLFVSANATDTAVYYTGLVFFVFGVVIIFGLINRHTGAPPTQKPGE